MIGQKQLKPSRAEMPACAHLTPERRSRPHPDHLQKCPRCESLDTKFCYYNNYSLTQPRYFCKNCKRYWTDGGSLRNVPVGGGLRKNKRSKQKATGQGDAASKETATEKGVSHQAVAKLNNSEDLRNSFEHQAMFANTNLRSSNPALDEKYHFDSVRWAQRLYESGEEASLGSTIPHFNYAEAPARNALHLFPNYNYSLQAVEGGVAGYNDVGYRNNLMQDTAASSEQGQSNNSGEMSEVLAQEDPTGAMQVSYADPAMVGKACDVQDQKQIHPREEDDEDEDEDEEDAIASKNKLLQPNKSSTGESMHDTRTEEISGNVVNPYDWQLISEGLFSTSGDFFYFPGASWPDLSHFESGPG